MTIRFGTDGIRGLAGVPPLVPEQLIQLGHAIASLLQRQGKNQVVMGRDTRKSGDWIEENLAAGLTEGGINVSIAGVVPTAAVSCSAAEEPFDFGIMITASHNPWQDNGVKFFGGDGKKLGDEEQDELCRLFGSPPPKVQKGACRDRSEMIRALWLQQMPQIDLQGVRVLLDCANGSGHTLGPLLLKRLGAEVVLRGCEPNGENINLEVGAMHPPSDLGDCQLGICLDGDADRVILLDQKNGILDGDDLLWLLQPTSGKVVGTVMTNGGLDEAFRGRLLRAKVGDRNVAKTMRENGATVGAETSGHVLFSDGLPTGDGLYSALRVLQRQGRPPFDLSGWRRWPTEQKNIRFEGKRMDLEQLSMPPAAREAGQRVIVRYSGTEPKLRVLVEGEDASLWAERICQEFREKIG
jgi:phosphoglucosamine mutase